MMQRRKFLIQTGMLVSATMIAQCGLANDHDKNLVQEKRRPHPDDFDTPALKAIALGMNAPNPHNTQAWKFKLQSDHEFLLYVDEKRILPATDPTTRQIHIGCGCFLAVMQEGLTAYGYRAEVYILPDGEYNREEIGLKSVAYVTIHPQPEIKTSPLSAAIYTRKTNRQEYFNQVIAVEDYADILSLSQPTHSSIRLLQDQAATEHLNILYEGMVIESNTYYTYEESRLWFRENDKRIADERDGINLAAGGTTGIKKFFAERILKGLDPKDWHKPSTIEQHLSSYEKKVKSAKAIVQFISPTNTQTDWIKTGMDYARFQLSATLKNYYIHPMSQVLQEFDEMKELQRAYNNLSGITGEQKIQMVIRIGKAKEPFYSYRRNVSDLVFNPS
jgi:hypothetical protein